MRVVHRGFKLPRGGFQNIIERWEFDLPWYQWIDTQHERSTSAPGVAGPTAGQLHRRQLDKSTVSFVVEQKTNRNRRTQKDDRLPLNFTRYSSIKEKSVAFLLKPRSLSADFPVFRGHRTKNICPTVLVHRLQHD